MCDAFMFVEIVSELGLYKNEFEWSHIPHVVKAMPVLEL